MGSSLSAMLGSSETIVLNQSLKRARPARPSRKLSRRTEGLRTKLDNVDYAEIDFAKTYALWRTMGGFYEGGGRKTRHDK